MAALRPMVIPVRRIGGSQTSVACFAREDTDDARAASDLVVLAFEGIGDTESPSSSRLFQHLEAHGIPQRLLAPLGDGRQGLAETLDELLAPLLCFRASLGGPDVPQARGLGFLRRGRADLRERIPQVVHVTALVHCVREILLDRRLQALVLFAHDIRQHMQAPRVQVLDHTAPHGATLGIAEPLALPAGGHTQEPEHCGREHLALGWDTLVRIIPRNCVNCASTAC